MKRFSAVTLAASFALVACKKEDPKPAPTAPAPAAQPAAQPAAAPAGQPAAAPAGGKKESDDACVGSLAQTTKEKIELGGQVYERDGYKLTRTSSDPDDQVILGVLSDVKEESEDNLKNVKAALEWFASEKVEVILYLGDSSETEAGVATVLKAIAAGGMPVFALVGNRECKDHWQKGMAAAQKDAKNLFDFSQVRLFNSDDLSVISMPGYYNPTYLHCTGEGCRYFPSDVADLKKLLDQATGTPLLISHGPPKMDGMQGLDRIHDGANVGDPALADFLAKNPIPFGAFANIGEAGGRATDAAGKATIAQNTFSPTLYVNPGFMDSVAWKLHDETTSTGMASVMTVKGRTAAYKIKRFGTPPAAAPATK